MKKDNEDTKMRISFDLDEVLFVYPKTHKTENAPYFPFNLFFKERLRYGTPELINALQELGFEVWVYTSSFRTESYIRTLFFLYGVTFDGIINGSRHLREVQRNKSNIMPQKVPSYYHISLHVDDERVICSQGRHAGFYTYHLDEEEPEWVENIIAYALEIRKKHFSGKGEADNKEN